MEKAEILRQRFARQKKLEMHCRILTPMFLGDAKQKAALRPEPFKGLLRYWWRVAAGRTFSDHQKMLVEETRIFGGGGEKARKSLVGIWVEGNPKVETDQTLSSVESIVHPEVRYNRGRISPFLYLGYGPIGWDNNQRCPKYKRSYLAPGETFTLKLTVPAPLLGEGEEAQIFKTALLYFRAFGAIGSRSRNGWGSFQVEKIEPEVSAKIIYHSFHQSLFQKDFPFTLAAEKKDQKIVSLVWRTKETFQSWEKAMKNLAEIYIDVRTKLSPDGSNDIDERHLLGFPLTHHFAYDAPNWGRNARHASPLRLFVRKKKSGYQGFILHLPFGISKRMRKNAAKKEFFTPDKQFAIWQKVHERLDQTMQRASINDCL